MPPEHSEPAPAASTTNTEGAVASRVVSLQGVGAYLPPAFAPREAITSPRVLFTESASENASATSGSSSTTLHIPAGLPMYLPRTPLLKS